MRILFSLILALASVTVAAAQPPVVWYPAPAVAGAPAQVVYRPVTPLRTSAFYVPAPAAITPTPVPWVDPYRPRLAGGITRVRHRHWSATYAVPVLAPIPICCP